MMTGLPGGPAVQPHPTGAAPVAFRHLSCRTMQGQDLLAAGPAIDPAKESAWRR